MEDSIQRLARDERETAVTYNEAARERLKWLHDKPVG